MNELFAGKNAFSMDNLDHEAVTCRESGLIKNSEGYRRFFVDGKWAGISVAFSVMDQVFRQNIFAAKLCLVAPVLLTRGILTFVTLLIIIQINADILQ